MPGASQSQIAAQLQLQLEKLRSADPFRTLEVPPQVDGDGVRRAYLTLTKKFHPNRFALEPGPTRDLANEVFLLIRRAYDLLVDDDKRKQWRDRVAPAPGGKVPRAASSSPSIPASSLASSASAIRVPTSPVTQRPATAQASPPPVTSPPSTTVRPTGTVATVSPAGSRPPQGSSTPTPMRTATVPGTGPAGPTTRRPIGPVGSGLGGASAQEVQAMLEAARTRGQRFDEAVALLARGKYREAREAFYKIAMEDPQAKRYRVQLHYAWGLEHLADGKLAEGTRELERALALEPESADIKAALARAKDQEAAHTKKGGILGKLFGR